MKRRNRKMIVLGSIMVLFGAVLIFWNISYSPFRHRFMQEMEKYISKIETKEERCTKEQIEGLPKPLQRYCNYIGLEGFSQYQVVNACFKDTKFIFDDETGKILNMDYDLWLNCDTPFRKAYCGSSMYGIPFEGMDYMTEEKTGGMKGILAKCIPLFDETDSQGYRAGLISWLAETVAVNPSVLFSDEITYEELDDMHVKATVSYGGVKGTGVFTINKAGEITELYSDERQIGKVNGEETLIGWRCECSNYQEDQGIRHATAIKAVKVYPDKEIVYFDADNFQVRYVK